jgi:nucleoside-diphosphate-sugar epimerase
VLHLAALIPPGSDEQPELAAEVNVDGTRNVIDACRAQPEPPRLLYTSTFDVHGYTVDRPPPRQVDDPVDATNGYTAHKIAGEELVRGSGLGWCILRLVDVPVLGVRKAHPIMFEIGLHNRIEVIHGADAALAVVNALGTPEVCGRVLFVGGGPSCQLTYREYVTRMLAAAGLRPLPEQAFATADYVTDWVDSSESQRLLAYQRYDVDDITAAIAASLGWRRHLVRLAAPFARAAMLRLSPYYSTRT